MTCSAALPPEQHGDLLLQFVFEIAVFILFGYRQGKTQSASARHDGDVPEPIQPEVIGDQRMTRFVVRGVLLFALVHVQGLLLGPHDHLEVRVVEVVPADSVLPRLGREKRRSLSQVGKIRAGETDGRGCNGVQIDIRIPAVSCVHEPSGLPRGRQDRGH